MKTRIIYPKFWFDEKFAECKQSTKLLFVYLITNNYLKLSRYTRISDRRILFETGLTQSQLTEAKQELQNLKWCFFAGEWIFHNHECAYVDYEGRDRVEQAKNDEVDSVPEEIKQVIKGLITGYEPVLNHKSKTINNKLDRESVREEGKYKKREDVTELDLQEISDKYQFPLSFIRSKFDDVCNWEDEKPGRMRGRNWKLTLINWCKRDFIKLKQGGNNGRRVAVIPLQ